ncbi:UPF0175 family protein [Candidatus Magnetomonas plexicatena]|uniref:UPF0175 family protein n=1 Tax=Candidatus Magnetomonas plexicatena TaxID=2552947 RepID=UPI0011041F4E|nr:hypothetical protein E2O03_010175 [Nitrospirales bacterium LBB_01]
MTTKTFVIDLPDDLPAAVVKEVDTVYLREALAALLYHTGKISEKQACIIVGKTRREFEDLLPRFGFSILSDSESNLAIEFNS